MRIGIDLDNTIVSYDGVFHRVADQLGVLQGDCGTDKQSVRDHLRSLGRNDDWTELQGIVYGSAMSEASPFPAVTTFFSQAVQQGWDVYIISHRTRHPYAGPKTDLHQAARDWLHGAGVTDTTRIGLPLSRVFFNETLEGKLSCIRDVACDVFIDDLPELLLHPDFPEYVERICFDPHKKCDDHRLDRVGGWSTLVDRWFGKSSS